MPIGRGVAHFFIRTHRRQSIEATEKRETSEIRDTREYFDLSV